MMHEVVLRQETPSYAQPVSADTFSPLHPYPVAVYYTTSSLNDCPIATDCNRLQVANSQPEWECRSIVCADFS